MGVRAGERQEIHDATGRAPAPDCMAMGTRVAAGQKRYCEHESDSSVVHFHRRSKRQYRQMNPRPILPLSRFTAYRLSRRSDVRRKASHQSGTAVIVVLIIIAILMIYVAGNLRTLN